MFKSDSEEAVWFQYINRLNDRALSKRRSSGFTTWAVCGVLAILAFRIIDRLPIIANTPDIRPLFLFTLSTSANLSFAVIVLFFGLLSFGIPASESRLIPKLSRTTKPIVFLPLIVIGFSIAFINFYTGYIDKSYYLPRWPYYLFGAYYLVDIALPLGKKFKTLTKFKGKYRELPHLDMPPYLSESRYSEYSDAFRPPIPI